MSRGLWFVAGAGAGVYAMVRGRRAAEALTEDGLRDRLGATARGLRVLGAEVAAGKAEREAELREQLAQASELGPRRERGRLSAPASRPATQPGARGAAAPDVPDQPARPAPPEQEDR